MNLSDNFRNLKLQEGKLRKGILQITDSKRIIRALELAKQAHKQQKRDEGDPYIIHLVRTANTLIFNLKIKEPDILIAGLLHDIIEDTQVDFDEIKEIFGEKTANLVLILTREKDKETKKDNFAKIIRMSREAALIKACDLLDNIRSLVYRSDRQERWLRHIKEANELAIPLVESVANVWLTKEIKKAYNKVQNMQNNTKKIRKILITGSSGTIGTRLFEKLLERGYAVCGFDKNVNKWHSSLNELTIIGNLLNKKDIEKIPDDVDLIIHLAANARVHDLVIRPDLALENVVSTFNILNFARQSNIKRIIFSSSREVYGNRKNIKASEKDVDIKLCESAYSASKISDEVLINSFSKCYGIDHIICRFSNVYGMYDESERFVPVMIRDMKKNKDINIFGKDKILDFTYIDDCVFGVIKCIERFDKVKNNTFNIAKGEAEKLVKVAQILKKKMNSSSKIFTKDSRTGEVIKYMADISKAKEMLGYNPKVNIARGLSHSIKWYLKNVYFK